MDINEQNIFNGSTEELTSKSEEGLSKVMNGISHELVVAIDTDGQTQTTDACVGDEDISTFAQGRAGLSFYYY